MLNKEHTQYLLSAKGKASFDKSPPKQNPPASPSYVKVMNIISSESDVCGLT